MFGKYNTTCATLVTAVLLGVFASSASAGQYAQLSDGLQLYYEEVGNSGCPSAQQRAQARVPADLG